MAANQNVVDELVVRLTLDADQYKKADKTITQQVDATERRLQQTDSKRKKRETEQIKRNKDTLRSVKDLAQGLRGLTLTIASVLGVGSVGGVVALLTGFAGMETGLRRAAVSTGLSNRELQAWSSTARRLGADAQAGASAIADLAREQKTFNLTGNAPTLAAFSRIGVRAGPNTPIADILEQAQQTYRAAAPAQKKQIESTLAASGVSPDIIVAIKSEVDAREAFNKSLAESTEENSKNLNALYDAISAVNNALTGFANAIATAAQPYIEQFGQWASQAAVNLGQFVEKVIAAGGGIDGFMKVLNDESPGLAANLQTLGSALVGLGQTALVIVYGLKQLGTALSAVGDWIFKHLGGTAQQNVQGIGDWLKKAWNDAVQGALGNGPDGGGVKLSQGAAARIAGGALGSQAGTRTSATGARIGPPSASAQEVMTKLVTGYGFSVDQAAAIAANLQGESGFFAGAFNPAGGGQGARGIAQWRGSRIDNFRKRYGVNPDQATIDQQLQFLATDPYERGLLNRALSGPGGAQDYGASVSRVFEGHGKISEDLRRGGLAQQYASQYGAGITGVGQQINIQSMTVQANNPQALATGIVRQSGVQNYNSAVQ